MAAENPIAGYIDSSFDMVGRGVFPEPGSVCLSPRILYRHRVAPRLSSIFSGFCTPVMILLTSCLANIQFEAICSYCIEAAGDLIIVS